MRACRPRVLAAPVAIGALALVAAACGGTSSGSGGGGGGNTSGGNSGGGSLTLGGVVTLSGPLAEVGQGHRAGAKLAAKQINDSGGVDGKKIKLQFKDEQADPQATVKDVQQLMGRGVKLLFGGTTDSDCLGAAPVVNSNGGVLIGTSCQTNELERDKFVPAFFEIGPSNYMLSKGTAQLAATRYSSVKTWDGLAPDYEYGHEAWANFKKNLSAIESSATFRKKVYVPLKASQFSSFITSLLSGLPKNSSQKAGLMLATFSATTQGVAKQGKAYDLFGKYKTVLNLGGSTPTAEALGADTPPLWFIYDYTPQAYSNSTNKKFVKSFKAANSGKAPNAWNYEGYTAVMAYANAIKTAHSTDPSKLIHTLAGMSFDTPKGHLTFRKQDHLLKSPVSVWHVVGDSSAPEGFKITDAKAVPVKKVLPPVMNG
jgi:branched-chain amino acid transport system substrate-binding protein